MSSNRDEPSETSVSGQPSHLNTLLSRLRPFQRDAFEFAVHGSRRTDSDAYNGLPKIGAKNEDKHRSMAGAGTGRILLGDEMGLGKTITSLAIMLAYSEKEWPLLILCPASLRYTWPAEIEKFCPWIPSTAIHVVKGKDDVQFVSDIQRWRQHQQPGVPSAAEKLKPHNKFSACAMRTTNKKSKQTIQIVVVTYSLLQNRYAIAHALQSCNFQCVIVDESHNLKQSSSQRCQLARPLLQNSTRLVLLSGTPALNRPVELWPQLNALDPKGLMFGRHGISYTAYTKKYCNAKRTRFGWDVKGVSNADELHACLKKVMVRRLKSEVLHDLPPKQRSIVPVTADKDKERECRDLMAQLNSAREALSDIMDIDDDSVANSAKWEARRLIMQAYQASGIAKAPATTEYILDWLEGSDPSQKLVIFAHHQLVLKYIQTAISKKYKGRLGMIYIDGSVSPAERALCVRKFQSQPCVRLALLSMTAAGVGLTLTAASSILFAELHWTPGVLAQAEDRCHRIGQLNSVHVMFCICKDEELSLDKWLWKMLGRKVGNLGRVVDGEKGKGLCAVEQTDTLEGRERRGVSAEEDLASFFASSSSTSLAKASGVPVKGTIQSFFERQLKSNKSTKIDSPPDGKQVRSIIEIIPSDDSKSIPLVDIDEFSDSAKNLEVNEEHNISIPNNENECCNFTPNNLNRSSQHPKSTQQCASANEGKTHNPQKRSNSHEAPFSVSPQVEKTNLKWTCPICTFINSCSGNSETPKCEMCGSKRRPNEVREDDIAKMESTPFFGIGQDSTASSFQQTCLSQVSKSPEHFVDLLESDEEIQENIDSESETDVVSVKAQQDTREQLAPIVCMQEVLSFSVSKNSGRIALHLLSTGKPLQVNFDVLQILTKDCSERLHESHLERMVSAKSKAVRHTDRRLTFDDEAIREVLASLDIVNIFPPSISHEANWHTLCKDIKAFVTYYMDLREVEKKAVKESGWAISASSLNKIAAKLLVSTVTGTTTERYVGGAKERAKENSKNNCATTLDQDVLNGKACAWCAKPLLCGSDGIIESTYCSQVCADEGRIRRGGFNGSKNIRDQLFALENGVCCKCSIDAHALYTRMRSLQPAERLNALLNANWKLPQGGRALDRFLQDPKESDFWQADHVVAVAEGGGGCGLDNLRTLCTPCHSAETANLRSRIKGSPAIKQGSQRKHGTQLDIMTAFSKGKQRRENVDVSLPKKEKRRRLAN